MRIGGASARARQTAPPPTRGIAGTSVRAFVRDRWTTAHLRMRPRERAEATADPRECLQSGTLDEDTLRDRHATRLPGACRGVLRCAQPAVDVDQRRLRGNLDSRRPAIANPAIGDPCGCMCVKTPLVPRAARRAVGIRAARTSRSPSVKHRKVTEEDASNFPDVCEIVRL